MFTYFALKLLCVLNFSSQRSKTSGAWLTLVKEVAHLGSKIKRFIARGYQISNKSERVCVKDAYAVHIKGYCEYVFV